MRYESPDSKIKASAAQTQADRAAAKSSGYIGIDPYEQRSTFTAFWQRVLQAISRSGNN